MRQYEFLLRTKSGDLRPVLLTIDMLPGTMRSIGSLLDITGQKEVEAVLEQHASEVSRYAETLRQTNDKLNLLNSITRHDILNQLTVIRGYLELLKMKKTDPAFLDDFIQKETQAVDNIQSQILFHQGLPEYRGPATTMAEPERHHSVHGDTTPP